MLGHIVFMLQCPNNHFNCSVFSLHITLVLQFLFQACLPIYLALLKQLAKLISESKSLEAEGLRAGASSSGSPRQIPYHDLRGNAVFGNRDLYSSAEPISMRPSVAGPGSRSRKGSH